MKPPHLPKQTCNIKQHHQLTRVKLLLVTVFFALLAGATGAIVVLGWVWPNTDIGSTWIVAQNRSGQDRAQLQTIITREINDKIFSVYESTQAAGEDVSTLEDKVGEAVAVSSDGWLVMYLPTSRVLNTIKNWSVLSRDGVVYQTNEYQFDYYTNLLYFKVAVQVARGGELTQHKVISFYNDDITGEEVFAFDGEVWQGNYLNGQESFVTSETHLDSVFNTAYRSTDSLPVGQPVINNRGWLIGFSVSSDLVLPARAVSEILPQVLSGQKIKYPTLGTGGWYGTEKPLTVGGERLSGYYVNRVWHPKSPLKTGDVVLKINGRVFSSGPELFTLSGEEKTLTLWRQGKEIQVVVPVLFASEADYQKTI